MKTMADYEDMLDLPHHVSGTRRRMSPLERAAQFSPFAALTGYEDILEETDRLTVPRPELTEEEKERIGEKIAGLAERIDRKKERYPALSLTYFEQDERKQGGSLVQKTGCLTKVDRESGCLIFADKSAVFMADVVKLELLEKCSEE